MEDPLHEELARVQVDRAAAHLAAGYRQAVIAAVVQIHLALQVLVVADAHVGRLGRDQDDGVGRLGVHRVPDGVVDGLRTDGGHEAQVEKTDRFHAFLLAWGNDMRFTENPQDWPLVVKAMCETGEGSGRQGLLRDPSRRLQVKRGVVVR